MAALAHHVAEGANPHPNITKPHLQAQKFQYMQVTDLRIRYLSAQKELDRPWQDLVTGAALIAAVATAIFCELAPIYALVTAIAALCVVQGIGRMLIKCYTDRTNEQAANALATPGFFEAVTGTSSKKLASAADIISAHNEWRQQKV